MGKRKESWSQNEDVALCHSWINVGGDSATGKDQQVKELWSKIEKEFEAIKSPDCQSRTGGSCEARWKKIAYACLKWRQALNKAALLHRSGENHTDEVLQAKSIFYELVKGKSSFTFEHCWPHLLNCQKFSNPPTMGINIPSFPGSIDLDNDDGTPLGDDVETPSSSRQPRPVGQKAAKAAKKKGKVDNNAILQIQMEKFVEHNDREFAQKQQMYEDSKALDERAERRAEEAQIRKDRREDEAMRRADDVHTMTLDASKFFPNKRRYWERKQKRILDLADIEEGSSAPEPPQAQTPSYGNGSNLTTYNPIHITQWFPHNN